MLSYNEVKERKYIILDNQPFEVVSSHVFRKQQRKPVNQTKLRNMINGNVKNHTFHSADNVEEAEIERKEMKFLYKKLNRQTGKMELWFSKTDNPAERFLLNEEMVGSQINFLKENSVVESLIFDENVIGIKLPIKMELKVTEAPPAVRGNTANAANKQITLETGLVINAPIFITEGDIVRVNTETSEYVERVQN
jgi:elongation factor P